MHGGFCVISVVACRGIDEAYRSSAGYAELYADSIAACKAAIRRDGYAESERL